MDLSLEYGQHHVHLGCPTWSVASHCALDVWCWITLNIIAETATGFVRIDLCKKIHGRPSGVRQRYMSHCCVSFCSVSGCSDVCRSDPHAMCPVNVDRPRIAESYRRKDRVLSVVRLSNFGCCSWCFLFHSSSFSIRLHVIGVFQAHDSGAYDRTRDLLQLPLGYVMNARCY